MTLDVKAPPAMPLLDVLLMMNLGTVTACLVALSVRARDQNERLDGVIRRLSHKPADDRHHQLDAEWVMQNRV